MSATPKSTERGEMSADREANHQRTTVGLCATCTHARRIASERGSEFWLCQLSATVARFAKYPRLPILTCPGYSPKGATSESGGDGKD
jgi:hypothetical protein